jgi:hypothetical protein
LKRCSSRSLNSKQMRSGRLLACSAIEQTTEDISALEGGGGLCRLQTSRDAEGAVAAQGEGRRSTTDGGRGGRGDGEGAATQEKGWRHWGRVPVRQCVMYWYR